MALEIELKARVSSLPVMRRRLHYHQMVLQKQGRDPHNAYF
ncbi:MAG: hypothetical protein AAB424_03345 [Patescibacteria group bacterium]